MVVDPFPYIRCLIFDGHADSHRRQRGLPLRRCSGQQRYKRHQNTTHSDRNVIGSTADKGELQEELAGPSRQAAPGGAPRSQPAAAAWEETGMLGRYFSKEIPIQELSGGNVCTLLTQVARPPLPPTLASAFGNAEVQTSRAGYCNRVASASGESISIVVAHWHPQGGPLSTTRQETGPRYKAGAAGERGGAAGMPRRAAALCFL